MDEQLMAISFCWSKAYSERLYDRKTRSAIWASNHDLTWNMFNKFNISLHTSHYTHLKALFQSEKENKTGKNVILLFETIIIIIVNLFFLNITCVWSLFRPKLVNKTTCLKIWSVIGQELRGQVKTTRQGGRQST